MNTNIHMAIINQTRRPCGSPLIKQGFFEFKESFYSEFTCTDHTLTATDSLLPPRSRAGSDHRSGYKRDYPRFNPRSRVGSDHPRDGQQRKTDVSIHAPAWGATVHHLQF